MAKHRVHTAGGSGSVIENREEIAALAHALWQARGCPDGSPEEDWFQAKRALAERSGPRRAELQQAEGPILARQSGSGAA